MKTEKVTVKYERDSNGRAVVHVNPNVVCLDAEDAIEFLRDGPMLGKMRVTFTERDFFKTDNSLFAVSGEFHLGDGLVRLRKPLPYRTTYVCEMLDENNIVIASSEDKGGAADPVKNVSGQ